MNRWMLAALVLVLAGCGFHSGEPDPVRRSIGGAARFLWSRQATDGGWHSQAYGLLRSGQALTPFVLLALLEVPDAIHHREPAAVERAVGFILKHTGGGGALGTADPMLADYPNYATSMAVRAFARHGSRENAARMILYLRGQQLAETLGWQPAHPAYGAWGMGGPLRRPPEPGHLDISMTRHVLEGLQAAGVAADDDVFSRAALFLRRCQNPDGGFFFSTVVVDANKAGPSGEGFRSYGTATADGVLSLLAMGVPPPDLRVKRAVAWMTAHHRTDGVPGFPGNTTENWGEGMLYYYLAGSARVFHRLAILEAPAGRDWRKGMAEELLGRQRPGGEWVNASFLMKEDDPLIATRFALSALLDTL